MDSDEFSVVWVWNFHQELASSRCHSVLLPCLPAWKFKEDTYPVDNTGLFEKLTCQVFLPWFLLFAINCPVSSNPFSHYRVDNTTLMLPRWCYQRTSVLLRTRYYNELAENKFRTPPFVICLVTGLVACNSSAAEVQLFMFRLFSTGWKLEEI